MSFLQKFFGNKGNQQVLSPRCAVCTQLAAEIELWEQSGTWQLRYSGPGGANGPGDPITAERAQAIQQGFTPPYTAERIQAAGFYDDAGFCVACGKFYCATHWQLSATGGGRCPAGHFKSLDPHWSPE